MRKTLLILMISLLFGIANAPTTISPDYTNNIKTGKNAATQLLKQ